MANVHYFRCLMRFYELCQECILSTTPGAPKTESCFRANTKILSSHPNLVEPVTMTSTVGFNGLLSEGLVIHNRTRHDDMTKTGADSIAPSTDEESDDESSTFDRNVCVDIPAVSALKVGGRQEKNDSKEEMESSSIDSSMEVDEGIEIATILAVIEKQEDDEPGDDETAVEEPIVETIKSKVKKNKGKSSSFHFFAKKVKKTTKIWKAKDHEIVVPQVIAPPMPPTLIPVLKENKSYEKIDLSDEKLDPESTTGEEKSDPESTLKEEETGPMPTESKDKSPGVGPTPTTANQPPKQDAAGHEDRVAGEVDVTNWENPEAKDQVSALPPEQTDEETILEKIEPEQSGLINQEADTKSPLSTEEENTDKIMLNEGNEMTTSFTTSGKVNQGRDETFAPGMSIQTKDKTTSKSDQETESKEQKVSNESKNLMEDENKSETTDQLNLFPQEPSNADGLLEAVKIGHDGLSNDCRGPQHGVSTRNSGSTSVAEEESNEESMLGEETGVEILFTPFPKTNEEPEIEELHNKFMESHPQNKDKTSWKKTRNFFQLFPRRDAKKPHTEQKRMTNRQKEAEATDTSKSPLTQDSVVAISVSRGDEMTLKPKEENVESGENVTKGSKKLGEQEQNKKPVSGGSALQQHENAKSQVKQKNNTKGKMSPFLVGLLAKKRLFKSKRNSMPIRSESKVDRLETGVANCASATRKVKLASSSTGDIQVQTVKDTEESDKTMSQSTTTFLFSFEGGNLVEKENTEERNSIGYFSRKNDEVDIDWRSYAVKSDTVRSKSKEYKFDWSTSATKPDTADDVGIDKEQEKEMHRQVCRILLPSDFIDVNHNADTVAETSISSIVEKINSLGSCGGAEFPPALCSNRFDDLGACVDARSCVDTQVNKVLAAFVDKYNAAKSCRGAEMKPTALCGDRFGDFGMCNDSQTKLQSIFVGKHSPVDEDGAHLNGDNPVELDIYVTDDENSIAASAEEMHCLGNDSHMYEGIESFKGHDQTNARAENVSSDNDGEDIVFSAYDCPNDNDVAEVPDNDGSAFVFFVADKFGGEELFGFPKDAYHDGEMESAKKNDQAKGLDESKSGYKLVSLDSTGFYNNNFIVFSDEEDSVISSFVVDKDRAVKFFSLPLNDDNQGERMKSTGSQVQWLNEDCDNLVPFDSENLDDDMPIVTSEEKDSIGVEQAGDNVVLCDDEESDDDKSNVSSKKKGLEEAGDNLVLCDEKNSNDDETNVSSADKGSIGMEDAVGNLVPCGEEDSDDDKSNVDEKDTTGLENAGDKIVLCDEEDSDDDKSNVSSDENDNTELEEASGNLVPCDQEDSDDDSSNVSSDEDDSIFASLEEILIKDDNSEIATELVAEILRIT